MIVPDGYWYSEDHHWIRPFGEVLRVGVTDYAQGALGDVVFVDLPTVGSNLLVGGLIGELESTKSVSELYAPVAGVVLGVNEALRENPSLINTDPYESGWICEISPVEPAAQGALLDAAAYSVLTNN